MRVYSYESMFWNVESLAKDLSTVSLAVARCKNMALISSVKIRTKFDWNLNQFSDCFFKIVSKMEQINIQTELE